VANGSLAVGFPEDFSLASQIDATGLKDDDINIAVTLPQTFRLGVQVRPTPTVRVEATGTWTEWSSLSDLVISDLELDIPTTELAQSGGLPPSVTVSDDVVLPTGYSDSWSARLGGDWQVAPWARVALGGHYETSAVPPATQGVNLVDGNKWGLGGGATFQVGKHLAIDVTGARTFFPDRSVTDSELTQLALFIDRENPEGGGIVDGKVVGNGDYRSNLSFLAVGATWTFGEAPAVSAPAARTAPQHEPSSAPEQAPAVVIDTDNDGIPDTRDGCPLDPTNSVADGRCGDGSPFVPPR
jgi:long-subunit fatty acid transport protein